MCHFQARNRWIAVERSYATCYLVKIGAYRIVPTDRHSAPL